MLTLPVACSAHHKQTPCTESVRLVLQNRTLQPIKGVSSMQDDYRAWELPHRDAPKPVAPRVSVPFDAETSYHDTYHAHPLEAPTRHHAEPWKGEQLITPLCTFQSMPRIYDSDMLLVTASSALQRENTSLAL